jgi:hypothetical protein
MRRSIACRVRRTDADSGRCARAIARQLGMWLTACASPPRTTCSTTSAAQVRRAFAPVDVLAALMLFVILLGLADTLAASVLERTRELGRPRPSASAAPSSAAQW